MSVYVVGDVQGCYKTLQRLVEKLDFRQKRDRLLFVGDLVNRGPRSAQVLRWVRDHQDSCVSVLGNHDLHLLGLAAGVRKRRPKDTLRDVLRAADADELIDWLRFRPVMHEEAGVVLVHAGLHPRWTIKKAQSLAREIEEMLRSDSWKKKLARCYERPLEDWDPDLKNSKRLRSSISVFTNIRGCTKKGEMHRAFSGPPKRMPDKYMPWFKVPSPEWEGHCIAFGHWSRLGLRITKDVIATDTGCVWGGRLTAVRLEDHAVFQVPCAKSEVVEPNGT